MMLSVDRLSGTSHWVRPGRPPCIGPSSPTTGRICPEKTVNRVSTTMATSGEGMLFSTFGSQSTIRIVRTNSPRISGSRVQKWGTCAKKIRIPRALTKPVMTVCGIKRIRRAIPVRPKTIWITPASKTAGRMYSTPCWCTIGPITSATEPAAAVTIAGRPPRKDMPRQSTTEAIRLTVGSTPAITEKEITSGISARAVITPARVSRISRDGERSTVATLPACTGVKAFWASGIEFHRVKADGKCAV